MQDLPPRNSQEIRGLRNSRSPLAWRYDKLRLIKKMNMNASHFDNKLIITEKANLDKINQNRNIVIDGLVKEAWIVAIRIWLPDDISKGVVDICFPHDVGNSYVFNDYFEAEVGKDSMGVYRLSGRKGGKDIPNHFFSIIELNLLVPISMGQVVPYRGHVYGKGIIYKVVDFKAKEYRFVLESVEIISPYENAMLLGYGTDESLPKKYKTKEEFQEDEDQNMYDAFISHASEDKDSFVRPLANELHRRGLNVWYDEFSLKVGDSLRRSIDHGLTKSCYGIVVLSPNFFRKEWPQKELDGLTALESSVRKVILPIWHEITKDYVLRYSPILADRIAISSSNGIEYIVDELLKVIKPKNKYEKLLSDSIKKWITHNILPSIEELYVLWGKIRPESLTLAEMAFLYYAYIARDDDFDHWIDNGNEDFSFSYLTDHIAKQANFEEPLLSKYSITKTGGCSLGLLHEDDKIKNLIRHKLKILYNQRETEAVYYFIQDEMNRGIEVLIIREGDIKSFVRYIPENADVEMQIACKLIEEK